jgi:cell fate regulator YaaT (PSP1 superfamily)
LRYEYEMYEKMQKELAPIGSRMQTPEGPARVVGHEILAAQLVVETDDRRRRPVDVADVTLLEAQRPRESARNEGP